MRSVRVRLLGFVGGPTVPTMSEPTGSPAVRQLRVVVEADDHAAAVTFFRDVLGLGEIAAYSSDGGAEVVILDAGRATLELSNPAQVELIDDVEVGRRVAPRIRLAFEVDDGPATTDRLAAGGSEVIAEPRTTPWRSVNSRLAAPAGLQITVFQELDDAEPEASGAD